MLLAALAMLFVETATTECKDKILGSPEYGQVCTTRDTTPTSKPIDSCAGKDWLLAQCTYTQHKQAKAHRQLKQDVGTAMAKGDCKGAVGLALEAGDLELAKQAKDLCTAAS